MDKMFERYSRQMLFAPIGQDGQARLQKSKVLIVGMGALGTAVANHLVRAGVGVVKFADRDFVELSNLQRQMLFDEDDVRKILPKAIAAERKLKKINRDIEIEGLVIDVTVENINRLLDGIDLVIDGTDNFATRFLLNDAAFKKEIPFIYGGVVGSRGMSALFIPNKTACLRCFIEHEASSETCDTVGVISPIVDMIASYEATEALKYLIGAPQLRNTLITIDLWQNRTFELKVNHAKRNCPTCQKGEYPALKGNHDDVVTTLCGRDSIQIKGKQNVSLEDWASRLERIGKVKKTPFLLQVTLPEGERLVLFPDGRALVQGTNDVVRAKTLYARYIGL
ncbi:ThiF family adenylyltransferase [Pueribacillus sp. YX66]|uniref:ThiF family adenylyltransferase n=1 Tax=Pueribacillus sp. YX66 TaxID=3229242 RepID=UPI00358D214C